MIQKIINDITTKEFQEERTITSGVGITGWRSSGLGTCMRGRFLNRLLSGTGIKPEIDTRTLHVFEIGNQVEDWLMNKLSKQNEYQVIQQGEMFDPELNLSGHFDALLYKEGSSDPKDTVLVECKSKHSKAFWYMEKKGEGAQVHHKMQLHSYLYMINKYGYKLPNGTVASSEKVASGSILYVSKDDMAMLEYPVFLNDKALEDMWKFEINTLNKCWNDKTCPPANEIGGWQEKYCDFCKVGMCQKLDDKMVKELFSVKELPDPVKTEKKVKEKLIYLKEKDTLTVGDRVYLSDKSPFIGTNQFPVYKSSYSCAGTVTGLTTSTTDIKWDNGANLKLWGKHNLILITESE